MKKNTLFILTLFFGLMNSCALLAANGKDGPIFYDNNKEVAIQAELFEFESEQQRQGAVALAKSLRCPQCQNQNLVESNSPVAKDLRLRVYQMVKAGKSDREIIEFMTHRFGDFVLYQPALSSRTFVLWFLPVTLLVIGLLIAIVVVRRARSRRLD